MSCHLCALDKVKEFPAELLIHFPGLEDLSKPKVVAFPKLKVCLECGSVEFLLPREALQELRDEPALESQGIAAGE